MILNPENLPKEKLKAELKRNGIAYNAHENKKYYVDLYRKKVLDANPPKSEFSDDDVTGGSPALSKRKPPRARRPMKESQQIFSKRLSDEELMKELIEMGENPGPITGQTRAVYERKLAKLLEDETLRQKTPPSVEETESFIKEWSDEEEEDVDDAEEEEEEQAVPPSSSSTYNLRRRDREPENPTPRPSRGSPMRTVPPSTKRLVPVHRQQQPSSDVCKTLWSLFFLLVAFVVVFLIYEHVTVPAGKTSLLTSGCDALHSTILSAMSPLMERQEVKPEDAQPLSNKDMPSPKDPSPPKEAPPTPASEPKVKEQSVEKQSKDEVPQPADKESKPEGKDKVPKRKKPKSKGEAPKAKEEKPKRKAPKPADETSKPPSKTEKATENKDKTRGTKEKVADNGKQ